MTRFWAEGEPIDVTADANGQPLAFVWREQIHIVQAIANRWRLDDEWWRGRVWREYFTLRTETGFLAVVYRTLPKGSWRLQRVYD